MDNKTLWIFLHPPRTGGGTILNTLLKRVPDNQIFSTSLVRYNLKPKQLDKNKVRFIIGHATYYGIHKLVPNRTPRYFIFLRDPAERIVSHYNAKMLHEKKLIPFNQWYKNQIKNEMVHFLNLKYKGSGSSRIPVPDFLLPLIRKLSYKATYIIQTIIFNLLGLNNKNDSKKLENAKKLLDLCWFVGVIENSDEDVPFLFNAMGIKNAKWEKVTLSKKIIKVDDKLRKRIYKDHALDVEIYNYALKLNKGKRPNLP